jgi:signal transduction histidine kinase
MYFRVGNIHEQAREFQTRTGVSCILNIPEDDPEVSRDQATAFFRILDHVPVLW